MQGSTKSLLVVGGIGIVALLFLQRSHPVVATTGTAAIPTYGSGTPGLIAASGSAAGSLIGAFRGLFSGPTTAPLTSGASASNPNELAGLPSSPLPDDPFVGDLTY